MAERGRLGCSLCLCRHCGEWMAASLPGLARDPRHRAARRLQQIRAKNRGECVGEGLSCHCHPLAERIEPRERARMRYQIKREAGEIRFLLLDIEQDMRWRGKRLRGRVADGPQREEWQV